jgi:hypothetical protein
LGTHLLEKVGLEDEGAVSTARHPEDVIIGMLRLRLSQLLRREGVWKVLPHEMCHLLSENTNAWSVWTEQHSTGEKHPQPPPGPLLRVVLHPPGPREEFSTKIGAEGSRPAVRLEHLLTIATSNNPAPPPVSRPSCFAKLMERCSDGVGDQGAEDVL